MTNTESTEMTTKPMCIATISTGFEKGDFLVREEQGKRLYFDFFEDAFNHVASRGFSRMSKTEEMEWVKLLQLINDSAKESGMKYNPGKLLMVMAAPAKPTPPSSSATKAPKTKKEKH